MSSVLTLAFGVALNSQENLFPENLQWDSSLEVRPRAMPGVTKLI